MFCKKIKNTFVNHVLDFAKKFGEKIMIVSDENKIYFSPLINPGRMCDKKFLVGWI